MVVHLPTLVLYTRSDAADSAVRGGHRHDIINKVCSDDDFIAQAVSASKPIKRAHLGCCWFIPDTITEAASSKDRCDGSGPWMGREDGIRDVEWLPAICSSI